MVLSTCMVPSTCMVCVSMAGTSAHLFLSSCCCCPTRWVVSPVRAWSPVHECCYLIRYRIGPGMNTLRFTGAVLFIYTVAPHIIIPPMQRVITVAANEPQNTTFVCQAGGSPTPQISWVHNGQNISRSTDERFQVDITGTGRSRLNITRLRGRDSGTIECVASSSVDIPNGQPLSVNTSSSTSSSTTLSVLSKYLTCSLVP